VIPFGPGDVLVHFKRGTRYQVVDMLDDATNARKGNTIVLYRSLHDGRLYPRDLGEFLEQVEWPDGVKRARFVPEAEAPKAR
jgi:hypothetical protein